MEALKNTWKALTSVEATRFLSMIPTFTTGWLIADMLIAGSFLYPHTLVIVVLVISYYVILRNQVAYMNEHRLRKDYQAISEHVSDRLDEIEENLKNG